MDISSFEESLSENNLLLLKIHYSNFISMYSIVKMNNPAP